jgi:hypothetical protein
MRMHIGMNFQDTAVPAPQALSAARNQAGTARLAGCRRCATRDQEPRVPGTARVHSTGGTCAVLLMDSTSSAAGPVATCLLPEGAALQATAAICPCWNCSVECGCGFFLPTSNATLHKQRALLCSLWQAQALLCEHQHSRLHLRCSCACRV